MTGKAKIGNPNDIETLLRDYITNNFPLEAGKESFTNADSFTEKGIIDSTGVLELLEFLEGELGIKVEDEEVIPDNLDSLDNLTRFIKRKLGNSESTARLSEKW